MSDDLDKQYQHAVLADFYGPADRLQRLLGLSDADEDELFDALETDPGITELMQPAHRRARALLQLVDERQGEEPPDEKLAAAGAAVRQAREEMEAWSR